MDVDEAGDPTPTKEWMEAAQRAVDTDGILENGSAKRQKVCNPCNYGSRDTGFGDFLMPSQGVRTACGLPMGHLLSPSPCPGGSATSGRALTARIRALVRGEMATVWPGKHDSQNIKVLKQLNPFMG